MYKKISGNMQLLCMFAIFLTTVLVISGSYSFFSDRLRDEIRSNAAILADVINGREDAILLLENLDNINQHQITLFDQSGNMLFDNTGSGILSSDVQSAIINGSGDSLDYDISAGTNTYSCSVRLSNGNILRVSGETHNVFKLFTSVAFPVLFFAGLLYLLCVVISGILTENITRPINELNLYYIAETDCEVEVYPELSPLINKIRAQRHEINRQLIKLKTRKTRFQTVSENINEGLLTLDTDGNILSINKSGSIMLGITEDTAIHRSFFEITDDASLHEKLRLACSGTKQSAIMQSDSGSHNIFFSPVFENGNVCGIMILILDITERLQAEKIRQEFTANVSHELKTPLTTILGYSQIINQGIAKPEDIFGFTQKIEREASRLITLINDIIKLSRLDEHVSDPEEQATIHVLDVAKDVVESLSVNASEKNVTVEISGKDFTVRGDMTQITELIYNLCDNSIKYNIFGGKVKILLDKNSITVSDTGIGIPAEYQNRIFERFFRVDKSRSKSVNGTGLGLSIVKHIAEIHKAEITVFSEVNKGTKVTVTFPDETTNYTE